MIFESDQAATLRALTEQKKKRGSRAAKAKVLTISSGKGGAGKTMLSVNLALHFARSGLRTLLVDLDPGLANVDVHMRLQGPYDVDDLLDGKCSASQAILVADHGLRVLPGGRASEAERARIERGRDTTGPRKLLDSLGEVAQSLDVIILDTGAGIGPWVRGALEVADCNLIVTQSDPASVTDAYSVLKVASHITREHTPGIVVNRVRDKREALLTATRLRKVTQRFLDSHPEFFGWIHERDEVADSVREQVPFSVRLEDRHDAKRELAALAARVADSMKLPTRSGRPTRPPNAKTPKLL